MGNIYGNIKFLIFDIDGVVTDGKKYTDGKAEWKSLQMKDLDAIGQLKEAGYLVGCISGEDTAFSRQFSVMELNFVSLGNKDKKEALCKAAEQCQCSMSEICYIGDGKYDIPALREVGLALCPGDATAEARKEADIVLKCRGGEGCLAEAYSILREKEKRAGKDMLGAESIEGTGGDEGIDVTERVDRVKGADAAEGIKKLAEFDFSARLEEHQKLLEAMLSDGGYMEAVRKASGLIVRSFLNGGKLLLCGNGGSAADAQHLAAELVGRFYLERKAWDAEALTANTSILTALANDYDFNFIFARQVEAKASAGDVLIGITTSGVSKNIVEALKKAKELGAGTVLLTGKNSKHVLAMDYADCCISIPSNHTPRIQEMHILTGHMICEIVEWALAAQK